MVAGVAVLVIVVLLISKSSIVGPVNKRRSTGEWVGCMLQGKANSRWLLAGGSNEQSDAQLGLEAWLPVGAHIDKAFWETAKPARSEVSDVRYYGQDEEDKYAHETFFSGLESGTYLELGAFDGMTFSNALFFAERGWKGVLVEPNTQSYRSLIDGLMIFV